MSGWARRPGTRRPAEEILLADQHGRVVACGCADRPGSEWERHFPDEPLLLTGWEISLPEAALDGGRNEIRAYVYLSGEETAHELAGSLVADVCRRSPPPGKDDSPAAGEGEQL